MKPDSITQEYYSNFDVEVFKNKLHLLVEELGDITKKEEERKVYYTEIYSTYLQVIEIFCINAFAISENNLLDNIFLPIQDLKEKIQTRFFEDINNKEEDFIQYLLNQLVFANKEDKEDRTQQRQDYRHIIKESIEDYVSDKDFLNSYKHGFRVFSGDNTSISIGLTGNKELFKLQDFSSSIFYYKKDFKTKTIFKCSINFNWERVYIKTSFLINILENMKKVYLAGGKEINFIYLKIEDRQKVHSKVGCFRICSPLSDV